jgi:hypothetical protein
VVMWAHDAVAALVCLGLTLPVPHEGCRRLDAPEAEQVAGPDVLDGSNPCTVGSDSQGA